MRYNLHVKFRIIFEVVKVNKLRQQTWANI